ncbi:MAG: thioredoxin family protein [Cyclobacteriaceae bacterium]
MRKSIALITGLLVVVAVLYVNASETVADGYGIGDTVSDFKLKSTSGDVVSMADYDEAKGFIVVFTCNTCPYAKLYEQRIIDLDQKFSAKGFPVLAINPNDITKQPDDSMEKMAARAKDKNYSFPYLRDDSQEVARAFGASKTPHVYVINKEASGKLRVEFIGAIDDSPRDASDVEKTYVEDAVNALLAGKKPTVTQEKAIGCTIKWKDA